MTSLFEILGNILPAIIAGLFTFFITKYTYNKNRPLDKLEIAYNRVYYPLYRLINNEDDNTNLIIDKTKFYIDKYDKYIDRSTLRAFKILCKCNTEIKKKDAYQNFKNNIYNRNSYLRRRLGYLEPSFLQIYTYSSKSEKSTFRILMELCGFYIFMVIAAYIKGESQLYCIYILLLIFVILIIELVCKFIKFLYYKIRK